MTDTSTGTPNNDTNATSGTADTTSNTSNTKVRGRWKQARIEEDPIIAPGYGRQTDLERLTAALNRESAVQLPVTAVEALMKAKGRGIRSSARTAETPSGRGTSGSAAAAAATPVSSAWADFMKEEGVNLNSGAAAASAGTSQKNDQDEKKPAAVAEKTGTAAESRDYLALPWDSKEPANKKARGPSSDEGGYLVQAGTLDASIVGRGKLSAADFAAHSYHLARPTVLKLPTLISKVFSAGHSVHAICLDANGQVYGWGRNEGQQLGISRPTNVYWPTPLDDFDSESPIVQAATGKSHSLFLNKDGEVWALGSNKFGQCGVKPGPASETVGKPRITAVPDGIEMAEVSVTDSVTVYLCFFVRHAHNHLVPLIRNGRFLVAKTSPWPLVLKAVSTRRDALNTDSSATEKPESTLSQPTSLPTVIAPSGHLERHSVRPATTR